MDLSYLSWLFSVHAETFCKSLPAQIWTPREETTGLWSLWKTFTFKLRSKECCFGSTHLSRLLLQVIALNFNPIDNSLQTIVCSAGRTDCFWLLCGQNPRWGGGAGIVCSSVVERVLSMHKSNPETNVSKATRFFPENHPHSLKLSTFSSLPALCGKRGTKLLNGTGLVSYLLHCWNFPMLFSRLPANRFACLSSCLILATLSQQAFRGQPL